MKRWVGPFGEYLAMEHLEERNRKHFAEFQKRMKERYGVNSQWRNYKIYLELEDEPISIRTVNMLAEQISEQLDKKK